MRHPFRALNFGLQIKGTGPGSRLEIHQDWSVTDEDGFRSVTFWIPLVDSHPRNGTVHYLLGDPDRFRGFELDAHYLRSHGRVVCRVRHRLADQ